jgi:hypothetical protein
VCCASGKREQQNRRRRDTEFDEARYPVDQRPGLATSGAGHHEVAVGVELVEERLGEAAGEKERLYFAKMRDLSRQVAAAYVAQREREGYPFLSGGVGGVEQKDQSPAPDQQLAALEQEVLARCRILATTVYRTYLGKAAPRQFDVVVIDEASMLMPPLVFQPWSTKIHYRVLVYDRNGKALWEDSFVGIGNTPGIYTRTMEELGTNPSRSATQAVEDGAKKALKAIWSSEEIRKLGR